ncbi:MAG: DUF3593 domain-containing protein [Pseudanabaenaceae cyanobacterium]
MTEVLFALSLFPYLLFLWYMTRNPNFPSLGRWGFYGTLIFVVVSIPAAIYAQGVYGKSLSNVDWLHGSAEFFLTLANLMLVWGWQETLAATKIKPLDPQTRADQLHSLK